MSRASTKAYKRAPPKDEQGWITKHRSEKMFAPVRHLSKESLQAKREKMNDTASSSSVKTEYVVSNDTVAREVSPTKTQSRVVNPYKTYKKETPAPLSLIRKQNKLYFSYDPRGYKTDPLPDDYCVHCRCPTVYCAEVVFGVMSLNHAETLAYSPGPHCTGERSDMKELFDRAYTKLVFAKIKFNGIDLGVAETKRSFFALKIPKCMKRQSLKKFQAKIEANNYPDFGEDWDEEKEEEESKKNGTWTTQHPIMKRTATEQAQDISVMFKRIKQIVKEEK